MPLPTHRLNLLLVPADPERPADAAACAGLLAALGASGVLDPDGRPGPASARLMDGRFALLRVDRPPAGVLYGSRLFSASCPACLAPVVRALGEALERWRVGAGMGCRCPACGVESGLNALRYWPAAAPARFAVELRDVERPDLAADPAVLAALEQTLGADFLQIPTRGP